MFSAYTIDCTGDVVTGDVIRFTEGVFGGSLRKPQHLGDRTIEAEVIRDSYGAAKQQHTFTLRVVASTGTQPIEPGAEIRRKGRNVYRNGTKRRPWTNEAERLAIADDKHERGAAARERRRLRKENGF